MISTKDILDLGLEHVATASNGGSMMFRINERCALYSNADNFLIDESKKYEINIKRVKPDLSWETLYHGIPELEELKQILKDIDY